MPFKKGQSGNPGGKPKGTKDKFPRSYRALVNEVLAEMPNDIKAGLTRGLKSSDLLKSVRYHMLLASLEKQQHEVTGEDGGPVTVKFIDA